MQERRALLKKMPRAVDLGLPSGIKWCNINIGAENPEDIGLYFSWANIEGHENGTYSFIDNNYYYTSGHSLNTDIPRSAEYDAAQYIFGNNWVLPTTANILELKDNCTVTQEKIKNVNGWRFTSKINGNSIFIPYTGYSYSGSQLSPSTSYLWTKAYKSGSSAYCIYIASTSSINTSSTMSRSYGCAIRPVYSVFIPGLSLDLYTRTVNAGSGSGELKVFYDSDLLFDDSVSITKTGLISSATYNSSNGKITYNYSSNSDTTAGKSGTITVTYNGESKTFTLSLNADAINKTYYTYGLVKVTSVPNYNINYGSGATMGTWASASSLLSNFGLNVLEKKYSHYYSGRNDFISLLYQDITIGYWLNYYDGNGLKVAAYHNLAVRANSSTSADCEYYPLHLVFAQGSSPSGGDYGSVIYGKRYWYRVGDQSEPDWTGLTGPERINLVQSYNQYYSGTTFITFDLKLFGDTSVGVLRHDITLSYSGNNFGWTSNIHYGTFL